MPRKTTVKPVTPQEVVAIKRDNIPPHVIEAFNEMIAQKFSGKRSCFRQDDVVALIVRKMTQHDPDMTEAEVKRRIYDEHWLDVEDIYRQQGWKVGYDRPGYNESYPATFEFIVQ